MGVYFFEFEIIKCIHTYEIYQTTNLLHWYIIITIYLFTHVNSVVKRLRMLLCFGYSFLRPYSCVYSTLVSFIHQLDCIILYKHVHLLTVFMHVLYVCMRLCASVEYIHARWIVTDGKQTEGDQKEDTFLTNDDRENCCVYHSYIRDDDIQYHNICCVCVCVWARDRARIYVTFCFMCKYTYPVHHTRRCCFCFWTYIDFTQAYRMYLFGRSFSLHHVNTWYIERYDVFFMEKKNPHLDIRITLHMIYIYYVRYTQRVLRAIG